MKVRDGVNENLLVCLPPIVRKKTKKAFQLTSQNQKLKMNSISNA